MNSFFKIYHFLGSIRFAIILIASVAIFVIAGTFLESITDSHRYAANFTYHNPLFIALLWGFFVNILVSALRRWPFRMRHLPFLITHAGLLMILGGALIKSYLGTQGSMMIMEGSGGQEIRMPDTYVVHVEKNNPSLKHQHRKTSNNYLLKQTRSKGFSSYLHPINGQEDLKIRVVAYSPHSSEQIETWFKGDYGYICGHKPFQIYDWTDFTKDKALSLSAEAYMHDPVDEVSDVTKWEIFAGRSPFVEEIAKKLYLQDLQLILTDTQTKGVLFKGELSQLLEHSLELSNGRVTFALDFSFVQHVGFENPKLTVSFNLDRNSSEKISIPLQGDDSLRNINENNSHFGNASITIDLQRTPTLLFLEDQENSYVFAFDAAGQVFTEVFDKSNLNSIIVYDQGFGGYAVQAQFPIISVSSTRQDRENAILHHLKTQLQNGQQSLSQLSPPLQLLYAACARSETTFAGCCTDLLSYWNNISCWILPEDAVLPQGMMEVINCLDWQSISNHDKKACYWAHVLFLELERRLAEGQQLREALLSMGWPLMKQLNLPDNDAALLTLLTQQVFLVAEHLPEVEVPILSPAISARLLSAYFRAYSLHLSNLMTPVSTNEMQGYLKDYYVSMGTAKQENFKSLHIECPLTTKHRDEIPQNKLEDNIPKITLEVSKGKRKEWVTLAYDRYGQGLKWPIFDGEYLVRFQPQFEEIPYRVRLRNARQINYANSSQPFSYESDLIITDRENNQAVEKTISMNHVHETWQGYRFYLASIAPAHEGVVKSIQIIVNHDPAKYFLTYPGALLLTLGILLLFWMKPYSKKSSL